MNMSAVKVQTKWVERRNDPRKNFGRTFYAFDADATTLRGSAFDHAKAHLVVTPRMIVQERMANRIIEAAHAGERNVT